MDVFGTVTAVIDLSAKLVGYIQAIKGVEEDCRKLLPEISALGALLQVLRGRLANSATNSAGGSFSDRLVMAGIEHPLCECEEALRDTTTQLEQCVLDASAEKSLSFAKKIKNIRWPFRQGKIYTMSRKSLSLAEKKGIRWLFHQGEIKTMLDRIERLKSLVSLTFQTSLVEFVEKAHDELVAMGLNVAKIGSTVLAIEADQRAHMRKTESLHVDLQALGWTLRDSANTTTKVERTVATIDRSQQDQASEKVLRWLSSLDFSRKHNATFEKHAPGTGEWFLGHSEFLAWRQGEYKVLWCPGGPGVGKSVMASTIVRHLQWRISRDMAIVYIYFDYTIKYTIKQLFEALLSQLMRWQSTHSGMESLRSRMEAGNRPTLDELINIFKAEAETYTQVFVVIDALDETEIQIWAPLLGRLRTLSGVSLLVTSRDMGEIALELRPDQRLDVMTDKEDIRKYIRGRLSNSIGTLSRLLKTNASLHEEIVTGVTERAAGMFLLARLHVNSLERRSRIADLRRALAELPGDLKTTYSETIGRISDEDRPLAYRIFSWLMHAAEPMTIRDLQYALVVEEGMTDVDPNDLHDEGYLMSICVGLIVPQDLGTTDIRRSTGAIGFVHYTTQQYLHDCISTYLPHPAHLAITCLRYISFRAFNTNEPLDYDAQEQLLNIPFARYAIFCWGKHARMHSGDTTVWDLAMQLLHDDRRVATVGSCPCFTQKPSAIQLCAYFGLEAYVEYLLDNGVDINSKDSDGDTAVTEAALNGQEGVVQLLLARDGVDVNPRGFNGTTPLSRAAIHGQQRIVELLLARRDVDVNLRDNSGITPVAHAADWGHDGVAKILLTRDDVDPNSHDNDGMTPIAYAAKRGHDDIAKLLLARNDVDPNSRDNDGMTPIARAVQYGNHGVVELLLARDDVDVNLQNASGSTPLMTAIREGREAIIRLLLARDDLDPSLKDSNGETHLTVAARCSIDQEIVTLLLARGGIDVNSKDFQGITALTYATCWNNEGIVKLLLEQDNIDINPVDWCDGTPLDYAEKYSRESIAQLLRAAGGRTHQELQAENQARSGNI